MLHIPCSSCPWLQDHLEDVVCNLSLSLIHSPLLAGHKRTRNAHTFFLSLYITGACAYMCSTHTWARQLVKVSQHESTMHLSCNKSHTLVPLLSYMSSFYNSAGNKSSNIPLVKHMILLHTVSKTVIRDSEDDAV